MIGGGIFVAGLLIQAVLTSGLHVSSLASYLVQAVVSVESSYFLNRWVTWKSVQAPFWSSFARFNLQKVVTVTLNLVLYGVLLRLGVDYLLANILLTVLFTFVNYIGADRLVFLRGAKQMVAAVTAPLPMLRVTGELSYGPSLPGANCLSQRGHSGSLEREDHLRGRRIDPEPGLPAASGADPRRLAW